MAASISLLIGRFFYGSVQAVNCSLCIGFLAYQTVILVLDALNNKDKIESKFRLILQGLSEPFNLCVILFVGWVLYAESWSSGYQVEKNPQLFFLGLSVPVLLLILSFTPPFVKVISGSFNHFKGGKVFPILSSFILLLITIGVLPFINLGPFSGTWSKVTGKLQSYSVVGKTGSTMNSAENALKFFRCKNYHSRSQ